MHFDDSVDYGNVPIFNLEYDYLSCPNGIGLVVGEKEKIASIECRLHAATK